MMIVEPKPEFRSLSEDAVLAARADPDPSNHIAKELARLIAAYSDDFQRHIDLRGYVPPHILHVMPRWPIEAVAMRLATDAICKTAAKTGQEDRG